MSEATVPEYQMPTPGSQHEALKPFEGTFKSEVKIFMGPGDPQVSTGTITSSSVLGGLYLHQNYVGDACEGPFPSFCGQGYFGYNTTSNQYEGFWIDNASTMMQLEKGELDASGKVWTMHSEITCPGTHQTMNRRTVITLILSVDCTVDNAFPA